MNNLLDNFGTNCFSEKNLKNRVPDYVVKKFLEIKNGKEELTLSGKIQPDNEKWSTLWRI